jgi:hypothetical protein
MSKTPPELRDVDPEVARSLVRALTRWCGRTVPVSSSAASPLRSRQQRLRLRRELVLHLFLQHYAPRIEGGVTIGADGWFAEEPDRARRRQRRHSWT